MDSLKDMEAAKKKVPSAATNKKQKADEGELSYEQRKEISRTISKLEKKVTEIEETIDKLENEISEMDQVLSSSEVVSDQTLFEKYDELKDKLEQTLECWESEHEELEKWKSKKYW
jgi:ATP-binding cassette subfamily F protein 3